MSLRNTLWIGLVGLLALAGVAAAQSPCPECDADGEPDDSWYSSVDTGVIGEDEGVLADTDTSVGENQHGKFSWLSACLRFWDALGNELALMWNVFVSEDGADVDATLQLNDQTVDLDETPAGQLDDLTWTHMPDGPVALPPFDASMMPIDGQDVDHCVPLEAPKVSIEQQTSVTARCEVLY